MIQPNDIVTLKDNTVHHILKINKKGIGTSLTNDNISLDSIKSFVTKKTNKALKFRVYPNKKQIKYFDNSVRTSNFIYNTFLRQQEDISNKFTDDFLSKNKEFNSHLKKYDIKLDDDIIKSFFTYAKDEEKKGVIEHILFYKSLIKDIATARKKYMKDNDLYFDRTKASRELTKLANSKELDDNGNLKYDFLKIMDSTARTYSLKSLDNAFTKIWKTHSGYPNFKNRNSTYSFTGQILYNKNNKPSAFKLIGNNKFVKINIPKLPNLKMLCHRKDFRENWDNIDMFKINSYTISKNSKNQYFIALQVIINIDNYSIKEKSIDKTVGIDLGIVRPLTTSNMDDFNNPLFKDRFNILKKYEDEKNKLSIILSKKYDYHKKNDTGIKFYESKSYQRIKYKLAAVNTKIANVRSNRQHNITSTLSKNKMYNTFVIEDLKVANMTKKYNKENDTKVYTNSKKKKTNLNKNSLDVGWNTIKTQLQYKAYEQGKDVILVDPAYTSRECINCGHIHEDNRPTQDKFICVKCAYDNNADFIGAINVKNRYINP